jgi:SAM-dependent methyltransferase
VTNPTSIGSRVNNLTMSARRVAGQLLQRDHELPLYAEPRAVSGLEDCYFYHTMDIPGHGHVEGQWDLRGNEDRYTGEVEYTGQRVLEVGTASGFLCFWLESRGAEVVAFDLSDDHAWDIVPVASLDIEKVVRERRDVMRQINNGYWLCHRAFGSRAKVVYGTVYDIPADIGPVDVATYCSVLLHFRDPFLALQNGLRLTRSTAVVTDLVNPRRPPSGTVGESPAVMEFVPEFENGGPPDTWWFLNPEIVQQYLGILGFEDSEVRFHRQKAHWGEQDLFTVVAHRTRGQAIGA